VRDPAAPILVAYNWSPGGRAALAWALGEGAYRHQPVRVIHVIEPDSPLAPELADMGGQLGGVMAEATNLGRVNVCTSSAVLEGSLSDHLIRESRAADLVVFGSGAAHRYNDPAWAYVWAQVSCPVAIVRGRARVPDRRPVLVAVAERSPARRRTQDEAAHEAELRDVGLFAVLPGPPAVTESRGRRSQLVVADLPRQIAEHASDDESTLRWVLDQMTQCPVLLVPDFEVV
jgi:nucleotide-binding universal stress UspA family protein